MKQKYKLGEMYWVLHNNQPVRKMLNFVSFRNISKEEKQLYYGFINLTEPIQNREDALRLSKFKEEDIFHKLSDLAKHYNLK